jgi:intracellular sulfur oxidation DsrE/DsrF family protein
VKDNYSRLEKEVNTVRKVRINNKCRIILGLLLMICLSSLTILPAQAEEYQALKGVKTAKAVFDIRMSDPKGTALHLKVIQQTFKDLIAEKKSPDFVLIFIGPSIKLVSTDRKSFAPEDQQALDEIAGSISQMSKDGIRLELCLVAAKFAGVDPSTVLKEIITVGNGWVSEIGYQAQGYSLVPVY